MYSKNNLLEWKEALERARQELIKKHTSLSKTAEELKRQAQTQEIKPWMNEVSQLYGEESYNFYHMIRLLRRYNLL